MASRFSLVNFRFHSSVRRTGSLEFLPHAEKSTYPGVIMVQAGSFDPGGSVFPGDVTLVPARGSV
ncbi:MAG TPA: hypothetical protein VFV87_13275, partial [Pirellulaceae bacterium]|nr:hypothetical protein [Pirellulaceae bacterium]